MKPAPFDYVAPTTIEHACALLAEADGGAMLLAGGQTLTPLMNLRMSQPFILVDLNRIPELCGISAGAEGVRIGAMTRQADLAASEAVGRDLPALARAAGHIGHLQTRNRGTVGGSIALGEPAAELPAAALALGAVVEARSVRGARRIPADGFYVGPYMTALEPDEIVTAIAFPAWPTGHLALFHEVARRPGDLALVGLVGALALEGGRIVRAGLAWFGMGPTPMKARGAEQALAGQAAGSDLEALADLAVGETEPFDDHHATAEYRRAVGRRVFARALRRALVPEPAA
jgi:carbon-monoxide dehydrogenase medium subunit